MTTSIVILTFGAIVALMAWGITNIPHAIEHGWEPSRKGWLARRVEDMPGFAGFVERRLDPTSAGGLLLTVGALGVVGLASVVGLIFEMVDDNTGFAQFDMSVAEFGVRNQDGATYELARFLTHLGGTDVIIAVTVLVGAWGWWRYKNPQVALFMVVVSAGQALINNGLKWIVDRDRPDLAQLVDWSGSSFPSGHSAAAAATYMAAVYVLTLRRSRFTRAFGFAVAAFIAASVAATRAVLGVHWLTDVIAGVAVGFAWFLFSVALFGGRIMQFGEPQEEVDAN